VISLLRVVEQLFILLCVSTGSKKAEKMAELAKAGDFCPNPACSDHEQLGCEIIKHGRTRAGVQRLQMPDLRKQRDEKGIFSAQGARPRMDGMSLMKSLEEVRPVLSAAAL
jgi:hypothetical protein